MGSLDLSRGSVTVGSVDAPQTVLGGTMTAQLALWRPLAYLTSAWTAASWRVAPLAGPAWPGTVWTSGLVGVAGKNWQGKNWQGKNWQGAQWYGVHDDSKTYGRGEQGSASYGAWD